MVSAKKVVVRFKAARGGRAQWKKIDKDWVSHVSDETNGEWAFTVKALEYPFFQLEMKSPGGKTAPPKGTYVFGGKDKKFRGEDEAKYEAGFWITDIQKGGGIDAKSHWKKV